MDHEKTLQAPAAQSQTIESPAPQPEPIQVLFPDSAESNGVAGRYTRSPSSSTNLLHPTSEGHPAQSRSNENTTDLASPPSARNRDGHMRLSSCRHTWMAGLPDQNASGLDWIVPVEEKLNVGIIFLVVREICLLRALHQALRTVGERFRPTMDQALPLGSKRSNAKERLMPMRMAREKRPQQG